MVPFNELNGELIMTVKELIEILKTADPDKEVVIIAPDFDYSTYGYFEYSIYKDGIDINAEKLSITAE